MPEPLSNEEHALLVRFRRRYAGGVKKRRGWTLSAILSEYETFRSLAERRRETNIGAAKMEWPEDERILNDFYWFANDEREKIVAAIKRENPLAYFEPSWEQAQMLNSWHPDFDPENAPNGYRTCLAFGGVQSGKTTAELVNALLWLFPNDPDWPIFQEREDPFGRGKYRVLPRFLFDEWKRSGRRIYDTEQPPKADCEVWIGCVDEDHFKKKIWTKLEKLVPMSGIAMRGKAQMWFMADKWFQTKWGGKLVGKLYNSEMQSWGGMRVHYIGLDEGPPQDKLDEAVVRCYQLMWGYSPREAANMGDRVLVAKRAYDNKIELPGFPDTPPYRVMAKLDKTPDRIMPEEDRRTRIAMATAMGDKGKPILGEGFFTNSPLVFNTFDRARHVLPWSAAEIVAAIRGEGDPVLVEKFHRANIIRGMDEGMAAPAACVWGALLRTGELVLYRDWEEAGLSISDVARTIIAMSGNKLEEVRATGAMTQEQIDLARDLGADIVMDRQREQHTGIRTRRFREVMVREPARRTFADSKIFKRDPNFVLDGWVQNYARAGLKMERSRNMGPAERCFFTKDMFIADHSRRHLNPAQCADGQFHGHRLYVSVECQKLIERMENYLQAVFISGPRKGDFTGKPEEGDDHTIDAATYVCIGQMRWIAPEEIERRRRAQGRGNLELQVA